jgi:hypothetical protein
MGGNHMRGLYVNWRAILTLIVARGFDNADCTQQADKWRGSVDSIMKPVRGEFHDK